MKKAFKALMLPAAAAGAVLAGAYGAYRYTFYSPVGNQNDDHTFLLPSASEELRRRSLEMIDALNARPYEVVSICSFDGLRLSGRLYRSVDDAPLAILFHGYRGTPSRDFSGGATVFLDMGWNVLSIEQRAHCSSEGHTISFGIKERHDCLSWCRYAVERLGQNTPILLAGISMGAATVLMASELALPESVRGIIADCPYSSPSAIIRCVARTRGYPPAAFVFEELGARIFGGFSLDSSGAVSAVRRARVPILLIHGEADRLVPCDMSREIAAANPEMIEFHTFPGAGHGISYLIDTERYIRLVSDFADRVIGARSDC